MLLTYFTRFKTPSIYSKYPRAIKSVVLFILQSLLKFVAAGTLYYFSMAVKMSRQQADMLKKAFAMFDSNKKGTIERDKVKLILRTFGASFHDKDLETKLKDEDPEETGQVNFESFCRVCVQYLESEDDEVLEKELKEAFRLYDKGDNGYIPTSSMREILAALDDELTSDQLDEMIAEIDTDSSGTVDFEEFMEVMTGD